MVDPRLKNTLLISGLQQSNNPLYQVIVALINEIDSLNLALASVVSGGGSSNTNINSILNAFTNPSIIGEEGPQGPPGPQGIPGLNGQTIMIMMEEYHEDEVYIRIN